jgi:hypothetical protein
MHVEKLFIYSCSILEPIYLLVEDNTNKQGYNEAMCIITMSWRCKVEASIVELYGGALVSHNTPVKP